MYTYEPLGGDHITEAAKRMVELWSTRREPIICKFNDIEFSVDSNVSPESIVEFYQTEMYRRHEEWLNSDAGRQAMVEAHEQQLKRAAEKSKRFHIGDILSITTGRLLSPRGMEAVYEILDFMTDDSLFTHQLPRVSDECKPYLLQQLPDFDSPEMQSEVRRLDEVLEAPSDQPAKEEAINKWLSEVAIRFGEYHMVERMMPHQHEIRSPLDDLP